MVELSSIGIEKALHEPIIAEFETDKTVGCELGFFALDVRVGPIQNQHSRGLGCLLETRQLPVGLAWTQHGRTKFRHPRVSHAPSVELPAVMPVIDRALML